MLVDKELEELSRSIYQADHFLEVATQALKMLDDYESSEPVLQATHGRLFINTVYGTSTY